MKKDQPSDYLWDRSGAPDPEIAHLEEVLGTLRRESPLRDLPARTWIGRWRSQMRPILYGLTAAAIVCLVAGAAWFSVGQPHFGWAVRTLAGVPVLDGQALDRGGRLRVGKWLETDGSSSARISIGQIGRVDVDPNSRVQLVESRGREHRMALTQGTIHARIWAPPRFFFVNTPSAVATDLGCAYTLHVDETGAGLVHVTHGWVGFEHAGRESFIPENAVCATRADVGPGTPRYDDAPEGYADALGLLDFGAADSPGRSEALDLVLSRARRRDALTLWHLLSRGTLEERGRVFDKLAGLVPPPEGVTRDAVLGGDRSAIDHWWDALGLERTTWWRLWKKKW
jgi:FecR protein